MSLVLICRTIWKSLKQRKLRRTRKLPPKKEGLRKRASTLRRSSRGNSPNLIRHPYLGRTLTSASSAKNEFRSGRAKRTRRSTIKNLDSRTVEPKKRIAPG